MDSMSTQAGGFAGETDYMQQFTDEDFQYSAAQFDTDYLEAVSSRQNADPSTLSRESLFVKFDPLVDKPVPNWRAATDRLAEIHEDDEESPHLLRAGNVSPVISNNLLGMDTPPMQPLPPAPNRGSSSHHLHNQVAAPVKLDLLGMDTPPKQPLPSTGGSSSSKQIHLLHNQVTAPVKLDLSDSHMTSIAQAESKRMFTDDQVAEMLEAARREEIEMAEKKFTPEITALEKELSDMEQRPGKMYDECMYVNSILSSQQSLLERELARCKGLLTEHEQLETLMVYCHEKFKEKYLSLAEQRDSTLKSEKFKVKSFEELQLRYLKLQEANKKLYQSQRGLDGFKERSVSVAEDLKSVSEACLLKQDELNLSHESVQKEVSSKIAVERAQTRTMELQVNSLEKDLKQKEQEKQQLTQIAEELMKELRNSE